MHSRFFFAVLGVVLGGATLAAPVQAEPANPDSHQAQASRPLKPAASLPSNAQRLAGANRYETAAAISRATFLSGVSAVFVANGKSFPDGLSGGAAAAKLHSPLLTVQTNRIPSKVIAEIRRLKPKKIYILGGRTVVNGNVENSLERLTTGDVIRFAGSNRYGTSAKAASLWKGADRVYLASGVAFPDALSGGAAAARDGVPLLLTKPNSLPAETIDALRKLDPTRVFLVGGEAAISDRVRAAVEDVLRDAVAVRRAGKDRYETSATLMETPVRKLTLASGATFPDALAGVAASVAKGASFALVRRTCIPQSVRNKAPSGFIDRYFVLGGEAVLANTVTSTICGQ